MGTKKPMMKIMVDKIYKFLNITEDGSGLGFLIAWPFLAYFIAVVFFGLSKILGGHFSFTGFFIYVCFFVSAWLLCILYIFKASPDGRVSSEEFLGATIMSLFVMGGETVINFVVVFFYLVILEPGFLWLVKCLKGHFGF